MATELFLEKGVEATTVDEIATRAGIAKGTFYHHFPSKAALVEALRADAIEQFGERVQAAVDAAQGGPPVQLAFWVEAAVEGFCAMEQLHAIIFNRPEDNLWTVSGCAFMDALAELLRTGSEGGYWRVAEPALTATLLFSGLHGVVDDYYLAGADPRTATPQLVELAGRIVGLDPTMRS